MKKNRKQLFSLLMVIMLLANTCLGYQSIHAAAESVVNPVMTDINVINDATAMKLAQILVGDLDIISARMHGDVKAFGSFNGASDLVGFDKGLALGTGDVSESFTDGYSYTLSTDFSNIPYEKTDEWIAGFYQKEDDGYYYDPAVLEFTVIPKSNYLSFQYAVASDEYPEYIETYWDKFILMVDGKNYALLPKMEDESTQQPVTIGNINHKINKDYYKGIKEEGVMNDTLAISNSCFTYDGITKTFTVDAPVVKGKETTIRIAIADYKDAVLDSTVFIKADSVQSKQALYGMIEMAFIDKESKEIYLRRKGGYNSAVSANIIYKDAGGSIIETKKVEFPDGSYINIAKAPDNAVTAELANPVGAVKLASTEPVVIANWMSAAELAEINTTVTGLVTETKNGSTVPAVNASVTIKTVNQEFSATTDSNGLYKIENVPGGKHNLLANNKENTKSTIKEIIVGADNIVPGKNANIHLTGKQTLEKDISNTVLIKGLDTISTNEKEEINLSVNAESFKASPNKEKIQNAIDGTNTELAFIVDINLKVKGENGEILKDTLDQPIYVTLGIPENFRGKGDYYIYHLHNNGSEVELLYDLDDNPNTITVAIDKFSEFALLVSEEASDKREDIRDAEIESKMQIKQVKSIEEIKEANSSSPVPSPSIAPTAEPTAAPTVSPSAEPTAAPTVSPSAKPTAAPTVSPSAKPTAAPTVSPTAKPTTAPRPNDSSNSAVWIVGDLSNKTDKEKTDVTAETEKTPVKKSKVSITFYKSPDIIKLGKGYQYRVKVKNSKSKVTWSVSNKKLAFIDKRAGVLIPLKKGTIKVYAKVDDVKKAYKVKIIKS